MNTALTELLSLEHPIIQAPMAGVSTPAMAAAVSNAGGLGSVALGALNVEAAGAALHETMSLTDGPIAANLFVHPTPVVDSSRESAFLAEIAPAFAADDASAPLELTEIYRSFNDDDEMLAMLLEVRPVAVSLHFGLASEARMAALREAGIRVLASATSVEEAMLLEASGVDCLVVQGSGAGGHSGAFLDGPDPATADLGGLAERVRETVAAVSVPVVAAGGIMSGADIQTMLAAGAAGAQLGTAYVPCSESLASEAYCRTLLAAGTTALTANISGRPARGLHNELMRWALSLRSAPPDYPLTYDGIKQLVAARNSPEFSVMWAGVGADRARAMPAGELTTLLASELTASSQRP